MIPATDPAATLPGLDPGGDRSDEVRECVARAGVLLARRARSEHELTDRLAAAGFDPDVVDAALARLRELRLVDDRDFARRWVEERSERRSLGPAALRAELRAKGVDDETIDGALEGMEVDEAARAAELAARLFRRVASKPLRAQAGALWQMLRRKGYSAEACDAAVKAVMPPEGWD